MSGSRPSTAATRVEVRHSPRFFNKGSDEKNPEKSESTSDKIQSDDFPPVGFFELFRWISLVFPPSTSSDYTSFSTTREIVINVIGTIAAAAAGAAQVSNQLQQHDTDTEHSQPLMAILFGGLVQDFVVFQTALNSHGDIPAAADAFRHSAALNASYLTYVGASLAWLSGPTLLTLFFYTSGVGVLVCTYVYMCGWVYTGEVNAKRVREHYLQAVLRQDVAYFDKVGAGEVATRIQTDTRAYSILVTCMLVAHGWFSRSHPAGHVREGCSCCEFFSFICHWLHYCLR